MQRASSSPIANPSLPEVFQDAIRLHPPPSLRPYPSNPSPSPSHHISLEDLKRLVKQLNNGSAPGLSGWTFNFLLHLLRDNECAQAVQTIIDQIMNGRLSPVSRDLITSYSLILIKKQKPGHRPIAIGEIFLRIASRYLLNTVSWDYDVQFARTPGGSQTALHVLQAALEANIANSHIFLALDIKNAFNSRDRSSIAEIIFANPRLQPIHHLFDLLYSSPSHLFLSNGDVILSQNDVLQGEALSADAFNVSMEPIFKAIRSSAGGSSTAVAIHDDLGIVSDIFGIRNALQTARDLLLQNNLEISFHNSKLLWPFSHPPPLDFTRLAAEFNISIHTGAVLHLGGTLGHDIPSRRKLVQEVLRSSDNFFDLILQEEFPAKLTPSFLRLSGIPRASYLSSVTNPSWSSDLFIKFDEAIQSTYARKMKIDPSSMQVSDPLDFYISLETPIRHGGRGLTSHNLSHEPAFFSSVLRSLSFFNKNLSYAASSLMSDFKGISSSLLSCVPTLSQYIPSTFDILTALPRPPPLYDKKLQRRITHALQDNRHKNLLASSSNKKLLTRLNDLSSDTAIRYTTQLIPSSSALLLSNKSFIDYQQHILGVHSTPLPPSLCPNCHESNHPDHNQYCILSRKTSCNSRHDDISTTIANIAREIGVFASITKRKNYNESRLRTDVEFRFKDGRSPVSTDVSVIHTTSPSYINTSIPLQLQNRFATKNKTYKSREASFNRNFIPFVITSFGTLHKSSFELLHLLGKIAVDNRLFSSSDAFVNSATARIITTLHQGNGLINNGFT